jgi:hypothetical protein
MFSKNSLINKKVCNFNMKKIMFICFLFLIIISFGFAQEYNYWLHSIDIGIAEEGDASVVEKFHLFFSSEENKLFFREKSIELGSSLTAWKDFDPLFSPTIAPDKIIRGNITYKEGEDNYLEIRYDLSEKIMSKGKETSFSREYNLKATYFNKLYQTGLWVIPDNTKIEITLPPGADIVGDVYPEANVRQETTKKILTWTGHTSGNKLALKYSLLKDIKPIIDLNDVTNFLFRTNQGLLLIGAIIVCIGGIIWKRHFFATKIEKFVENNTRFEEN